MTADLGSAIIQAVERFGAPILGIEDPEGVRRLLHAAGWVEVGGFDVGAAATAVRNVADSLSDALANPPTELFDVLVLCGRLAEPFAALADVLRASPDTPPDVVTDVAEMLAHVCLSRAGPLPAVLDLLGISEEVEVPELVAGGWRRRATRRRRIFLDRLTATLRDPGRRLRELAAEPATLAAVAWPLVIDGLETLGIGATTAETDPAAPDADGLRRVLVVDVLTRRVPPEFARIVIGFEQDPTGRLQAIAAVSPGLEGQLQRDGWSGSISIPGTQHLRISGDGISLEAGGNEFGVQVAYVSSATPALRLGAIDGVHVAIDGVRLEVGIQTGGAGLDVVGTLQLSDVRLSLQTGDGFLSTLLGSKPIAVGGDASIRLSARSGLTLSGGAGTEVLIAESITLGPVEVTDVRLAFRLDDHVAVRLSAGIGAHLGPFQAQVHGLGLGVHLTAPSGRTGNLGTLDVAAFIRPPDGVGLAITTPAVKGGGFLLFDHEAGQYAGVFELTIANTVSVKVVGLISTKLPDGRPGFALLIIITAEGFTPIQLGMGFVLTGIGGLLALNRTVDVDAVRGGLKSGVLDSVLFVKDPVANAGRLISTLNRVFPQAPDRLVIGPMVTIGWGSPPIITARVAVLLEVPDPLRLIVLASVAMLLPDGDDPIVQLRVDAVGVLDLNRGELSLDASIYDSRLWKFALTGDMALRIRWGRDPQFIFAVGGFHPRFEAPAGFPQLERVALTLTDSDNPRLRIECYLAVTSNTIQFGGRVELYVAAFGFEISGDGGFDALVQWSPFLFMLDVYVRVTVRFGAVTVMALALEVALSGPTPWRARGRAEVQFLAIKAEVAFDWELGAPTPPEPVEEIDVAGLLWQAVTDPGNWDAALPAELSPGVTVRAWADIGLLAHPLASITVRQRIVPLDVEVTRVGARVPKGGATTYRLEIVTTAAIRALHVAEVTAPFALGQFQSWTDDDRLVRKSFSDETAGYTVAVDSDQSGIPIGESCESTVMYESLQLTNFDEPADRTGTSPGLGAVSASGGVDDRPAAIGRSAVGVVRA